MSKLSHESGKGHLRIALAQAFSAADALTLLDAIPRLDSPNVVLFPECCFQGENFCDLLDASAAKPMTSIISTILLEQEDHGEITKINQVIRCINGVGRPIYRGIKSGIGGSFPGDGCRENIALFHNQRGTGFVATSSDLENLREMGVIPRILLVPGNCVGDQVISALPDNFSGHLFFSNGDRCAKQSSFYRHITTERPIEGKGALGDFLEIPGGTSKLIEVSLD